MKRFLIWVNIPYQIANHVVGKHHTQIHRRVAGFFVMIFGVGIAHVAQHEFNAFVGLFGDLVGYSIHATGFMPYATAIENSIVEHQNEQQNEHHNEPCNG